MSILQNCDLLNYILNQFSCSRDSRAELSFTKSVIITQQIVFHSSWLQLLSSSVEQLWPTYEFNCLIHLLSAGGRWVGSWLLCQVREISTLHCSWAIPPSATSPGTPRYSLAEPPSPHRTSSIPLFYVALAQ